MKVRDLRKGLWIGALVIGVAVLGSCFWMEKLTYKLILIVMGVSVMILSGYKLLEEFVFEWFEVWDEDE